jgi:hypothetical protein
MRQYQVNFRRLVALLLPTFLRRDVISAFLNAAGSAISLTYNGFMTNRNNNLYRLKMNGQVCYLRRVLNDAFPEANNEIRIEDGGRSGGWVYAWDEDFDPSNEYTLAWNDGSDEATLIWDQGAILEGVSGFIVYVPSLIYNINNDAKIRSLLNNYKLLSKSYTIIYE